MKKIFLVLAFAFVFAVNGTAVFAENADSNEQYVYYEKDDSKWTNMTYDNVPVLKILEGKDAYVVVYQKNHIGVGSTVIPKKWAIGNKETPKKLVFRNVNTQEKAYISVVKKDGEFLKVVLNTPMKKSNPIWGVISNGKVVEGADKDSLEELDLF